jgi:hypothetical protein
MFQDRQKIKLASDLMIITDAHSILNGQPPVAWNGGIGFISKEIIQSFCPAPAPDIKVVLISRVLHTDTIRK